MGKKGGRTRPAHDDGRGQPAGSGSAPSTAQSAAAVALVAAAVAFCGGGVMLAGRRSPRSEPADWQSVVPFCDFGADFQSVAELMERRTPCLVRGLEVAKHAEVTRAWAPETILRLPAARGAVKLRATEGPNHTRVMRYSDRNLQKSESAFKSKDLGIAWSRGAYDSWEFEQHTMRDVLRPGSGFSASFSANTDMFRAPHPSGAAAIEALAESIPGPQGEMQEQLLWLASRGLGQQLHFDSSHNLFFQLHGEKHVVMCPPAELLRRGHLYPKGHPASRQSQILWGSEDSDRRMVGFGTPESVDVERPGPAYNASTEQVAYLRGGDVLYIPALWGHQTFSQMDGPTVSLALWYHPGTSAESPIDVRLKELDDAIAKAMRDGQKGAKNAGAKWAALRDLGLRVVAHVLAVNGVPLSEAEAGDVVADWIAQRWWPQFGGLGIKAPTSTAPEPVCQPWADREQTEASVAKLAPAVRKTVSWYFEEHREAYLHYHLGNILDALVLQLRATRIAKDLKATGLAEPGAQVGALLHSFTGCEGR